MVIDRQECVKKWFFKELKRRWKRRAIMIVLGEGRMLRETLPSGPGQADLDLESGRQIWETLGSIPAPACRLFAQIISWRRVRIILSNSWSCEDYWCWSWSSNTLATWCEELTHWKRPWCWERLKAGGEGDDRGWDGWMASPTQLKWVWASSGSWSGKPSML